MMKKRAKVHLLPTEPSSAEACIGVRGNIMAYHLAIHHLALSKFYHIYVTTDDEIKEGDWFIAIDSSIQRAKSNYEKLPNDKKIIATTDPELKDDVCIGGAHFDEQLPQIPQSFIEEYCKVGGIDEVDVEYERDFSDFLHWASNQGYSYDKHFGWEHSNGRRPNQSQLEKEFESVPKINSNNEIIIHLIGDKVYSKDEVYKLAKVAYRMGAQNHNDATVERFDEWIKTFL